MVHPGELRFPSIDALRAFEAAARLGTFERAGEELAVTASAVSKRVATVEELLGTALFVRGPKALQLTPTGREYLAQVGAALGLLAAMPQHRREVQRVQKLRITSPPTFARQILVPRLDSFTAAHPEVELEVVLSIPFLEMARAGGESDIEVRHGPAIPGGRQLLHERVLPMAAPSCASAGKAAHQRVSLAPRGTSGAGDGFARVQKFLPLAASRLSLASRFPEGDKQR